jgi:hypothetical protein
MGAIETQAKRPRRTGAFLLEKIKRSLVLQPEIRDVAVAMRDLGIDHENPFNDREKPAEEAGGGGEAERSGTGHLLFLVA